MSTGYVVGSEKATGGEDPVLTALRLEEPVEFCDIYARGSRDISLTQDPSHLLGVQDGGTWTDTPRVMPLVTDLDLYVAP